MSTWRQKRLDCLRGFKWRKRNETVLFIYSKLQYKFLKLLEITTVPICSDIHNAEPCHHLISSEEQSSCNHAKDITCTTRSSYEVHPTLTQLKGQWILLMIILVVYSTRHQPHTRYTALQHESFNYTKELQHMLFVIYDVIFFVLFRWHCWCRDNDEFKVIPRASVTNDCNVITNNPRDYNGAQFNTKKEFHSLYISRNRSVIKAMRSHHGGWYVTSVRRDETCMRKPQCQGTICGT
jgi:hypothetical protein